jgi:nicotinic acid phosphoribosyltransferase
MKRPPTPLLLTDLYQLTMLQAYFGQGMNGTAVFEFFVRKLPPGRNFLMAAGLAQAQLVETRLVNLLQLQTMVASKAVRARLAAPGKLLVDFGLRRAHGAEVGWRTACWHSAAALNPDEH